MDKKEIEKKLLEVKRPTWQGMLMGEMRRELIALYEQLLSKKQLTNKEVSDKPFWIDEYLNQNSRSVIKSLTKDKISKTDLRLLLNEELKGKNRAKILSIIQKRL